MVGQCRGVVEGCDGVVKGSWTRAELGLVDGRLMVPKSICLVITNSTCAPLCTWS